MKFKDFRQTELFKSMDICEYYDANMNPIDERNLFNKIRNKEVLKWQLKPTPPLNTLVIVINL